MGMGSRASNEGARDGNPAEQRERNLRTHGYTAEDKPGARRGEGHGPEGYRAEPYPGDNPLRNESEREEERRLEYAWTWPRPVPEALGGEGGGLESDRRICDEIGSRIATAEPNLEQVVVRVLDGEVWLDGSVAALEDKHVVEGLAGNVEGVLRLESRSTVDGER